MPLHLNSLIIYLAVFTGVVGIVIYETKKGQLSLRARADFCPISAVTCQQTAYTKWHKHVSDYNDPSKFVALYAKDTSPEIKTSIGKVCPYM